MHNRKDTKQKTNTQDADKEVSLEEFNYSLKKMLGTRLTNPKIKEEIKKQKEQFKPKNTK